MPLHPVAFQEATDTGAGLSEGLWRHAPDDIWVPGRVLKGIMTCVIFKHLAYPCPPAKRHKRT